MGFGGCLNVVKILTCSNLQALSKALMELRADMVSQAQDDVLANAENARSEQNLQKILDAHTKDLQDRVEELEAQSQKWKQEAKKRRNKEVTLTTEVDDTKQDLGVYGDA